MIEHDCSQILVVEDNDGDFLLVKEYLMEAFPSATLYHDKRLQDAILNLKQCTFDVILLDLTLPDSDGFDSIDQIIATAPNTPVIVLTGFANKDFGITTLSKGVSDYLLKDELNAWYLHKSIAYSMERKRIVKAIEEQNAQLREIAWIQSHVVRAPLARMMGLVQLMKQPQHSSDDNPALLDEIMRSAQELDVIIRDIIKRTAKIENGERIANNTP